MSVVDQVDQCFLYVLPFQNMGDHSSQPLSIVCGMKKSLFPYHPIQFCFSYLFTQTRQVIYSVYLSLLPSICLERRILQMRYPQMSQKFQLFRIINILFVPTKPFSLGRYTHTYISRNFRKICALRKDSKLRSLGENVIKFDVPRHLGYEERPEQTKLEQCF